MFAVVGLVIGVRNIGHQGVVNALDKPDQSNHIPGGGQVYDESGEQVHRVLPGYELAVPPEEGPRIVAGQGSENSDEVVGAIER